MHSPECVSIDEFSVSVGAGLVGSGSGPESFEWLAVAEGVCAELQDGIGGRAVPELFRALHADVDLFDRGFDVAAGQR